MKTECITPNCREICQEVALRGLEDEPPSITIMHCPVCVRSWYYEEPDTD